MKPRKQTVWARTLRAAAAAVQVDASTLSRWQRHPQFNPAWRTVKGWDVAALRQFRDARRKASLDPRIAAPDPDVEALVEERDRLKTLGLRLHAAVLNGVLCDKSAAEAILSRHAWALRQALRSALGFVGYSVQSPTLTEALTMDVFAKVLTHIQTLRAKP